MLRHVGYLLNLRKNNLKNNNITSKNFDENLAKKVGVNSAIIFYNISWWIKKNEDQGSKFHFHNNKYWTFNSVPSFQKVLPFLTINQVRRCLEKLVHQQYLEYDSFNRFKYDKTKWYSIGEKGLMYHIGQKCPIDVAESPDPYGKNAGPIPDYKLNYKPDYKLTPTSCGQDGCADEEKLVVIDCQNTVGYPVDNCVIQANTTLSSPLVTPNPPPLIDNPIIIDDVDSQYNEFIDTFNSLFKTRHVKTQGIKHNFIQTLSSFSFDEIMTSLKSASEDPYWQNDYSDEDFEPLTPYTFLNQHLQQSFR